MRSKRAPMKWAMVSGELHVARSESVLSRDRKIVKRHTHGALPAKGNAVKILQQEHICRAATRHGAVEDDGWCTSALISPAFNGRAGGGNGI